MINLAFHVIGAYPDPHAAAPALLFRVRIEATPNVPIHAVLLRCLVQIEPRRRHHAPQEQDRLADLFGESGRWRDTLRPLVWARVSVSVPAFENSIEIDLPVPCTYDFEVAGAKYLEALEGGDVPLLLLFSGSVFAKTDGGFQVQQIAWDKEAVYRMPVQVWRDLMDAYFPGCTWIRLRRESLDALQRFRVRKGLMSWDDVIEALVLEREVAAR